MKRGEFLYRYSCWDQDRLRIFKRREAFVIVLIRLKLADGTLIPSDRPNSKEILTPQCLIYRYKIDLGKKMDYSNPNISLEKTYIGEQNHDYFD